MGLATLHRVATSLAWYSQNNKVEEPAPNRQQRRAAVSHRFTAADCAQENFTRPLSCYDYEAMAQHGNDFAVTLLMPERVGNLDNSALVDIRTVGGDARDSSSHAHRVNPTHVNLFAAQCEGQDATAERPVRPTDFLGHALKTLREKTEVKASTGELRGHVMYLRITAGTLMGAAHTGFVFLDAGTDGKLAMNTSLRMNLLGMDGGEWREDCLRLAFTPAEPAQTLGEAIMDYLLFKVGSLSLHSMWQRAEIIPEYAKVTQLDTQARAEKRNDEAHTIFVRNTAWGAPHNSVKKGPMRRYLWESGILALSSR